MIVIAEYTLPSHWACYLINGDASGMEDQADCDAFLAAHPELGGCLDVEDLGFSWCNDWTHLGGDVSLFTFPVEDKQRDEQP